VRWVVVSLSGVASIVGQGGGEVRKRGNSTRENGPVKGRLRLTGVDQEEEEEEDRTKGK
jgi:hypothetical protein